MIETNSSLMIECKYHDYATRRGSFIIVQNMQHLSLKGKKMLQTRETVQSILYKTFPM